MTDHPVDGSVSDATQPTSIVGRVLYTLELLARAPRSAAQVGRELGTNRSTSLRLLSELVDTGYVQRDVTTKRYSIVASRVLALAPATALPPNWSEAVRPVLAKIRDRTGDSALLSVPVGLDIMYLAYCPTTHVVSVSEGVGAVRPMHCSAQGKAYLSGLPDDEFEALATQFDYELGNASAAKSPRQLRERVAQARKEGYALDLEETYEGVRCVAVPMRIRGMLVGAIGITAPASRMPMGRMRELGVFLAEMATGLSPAGW